MRPGDSPHVEASIVSSLPVLSGLPADGVRGLVDGVTVESQSVVSLDVNVGGGVILIPSVKQLDLNVGMFSTNEPGDSRRGSSDLMISDCTMDCRGI